MTSHINGEKLTWDVRWLHDFGHNTTHWSQRMIYKIFLTSLIVYFKIKLVKKLTFFIANSHNEV